MRLRIEMKEEEKSLLSKSCSNSYESVQKQKFNLKGDNLAYMCFFVIGIAMLLPWNFFINADQYFKDKLNNNSGEKKLFESAFSICSQIPCGIALVLNLYLTDRVSRNVRVFSTLIVSISFFLLTTALVNANTSKWTQVYFAITLLSIVVINFCIGIFQGTIFGIASAMGARYVQGAVLGMSMAGTFTSLSNLLSLAVANDIKINATIYFSTATAILIVCFLMYCYTTRSKSFRRKFTTNNTTLPDEQNVSFIHIVKIIQLEVSTVFFVFTVTIAIMPSILSGIQSMYANNNSEWNTKYFSGLVTFLLFNVGDFCGRVLSGFVRPRRGKWFIICSLLRVAFIPLFMLCNYQPRKYLPVVFDSDLFPVAFNVLFSLSNGYLCSVCMMSGPEHVFDQIKEKTGAVMQLCLTMGTVVGAGLSLLLVYVI